MVTILFFFLCAEFNKKTRAGWPSGSGHLFYFSLMNKTPLVPRSLLTSIYSVVFLTKALQGDKGRQENEC